MRIETKTEQRPTHEQIQRRAYDLWEKAGRQPGHDQDYWLQAEVELRGASRATGNGPVPPQIISRRLAARGLLRRKG